MPPQVHSTGVTHITTPVIPEKDATNGKKDGTTIAHLFIELEESSAESSPGSIQSLNHKATLQAKSMSYEASRKGHLMPSKYPNQQPSDASPSQPSPKKAAVTPSGPRGDNPSTAGPGQTAVRSNTPENASGHLNPSAPEDANTTPGTTGKK